MRRLLAILALVALTGCGDDAAPPAPPVATATAIERAIAACEARGRYWAVVRGAVHCTTAPLVVLGDD